MAGALQTMFSEVHASTKVDFDIQPYQYWSKKKNPVLSANPELA